MAICDISGTLFKTIGLTAGTSSPLTNFDFTVSEGELDGQAIGNAGVTITTDSSGDFSFAAEQGTLITVQGQFALGDYDFRRGIRLFVPYQSSIDFDSLLTPDDYCQSLGNSAIYAPATAAFILKTANATLSNAQVLGSLATGMLKNTTTTGVLSIATAADLPTPTTLTEEASPDGAADFLLVWDISAGDWKKLLPDNLPSSGSGAVSSVFGRTGAVVAAQDDYTFAQLASKPTTLSGYGITDAQPLDSDLTSIAALTTTSFGRGLLTETNAASLKTTLSLGNVENTALSTWAGSTNLTTLGTISAGTWNGSVIGSAYGGAGTVSGILKANGSGTVSAAVSATDYAPATSGSAILKGNGAGGFSSASGGTDYEVPITFSTGLTRSVNTVTVNTSQNINTLSNLTSNGLVTTSGGAGTLGVTVPGTGVLTALAVNVGSAGAFVTFNGAGGTPSSMTGTNITGTASGLTAGAATVLATARAINGVNFDGSAAITVTAAAGTLTGSTLNSGVTASSLTSFGTVTSGTLSTGAVIGGVTMTLGSDATGDIYYRNSGGVLTRLGVGSNGQVLTLAAGLPSWAAAAGTGDVTGPGSATDNALVRFDSTTGKIIQDSVVIVGDTGAVSGITSLTFTGVLTGGSGPTTITDAAGKILSAALNTVAVAQGGTGLTTGTSGGILGYTASGTLASSVALTANALILGGGTGATPTPMGSLGTTTTVLHGNAGGAPTFSQIVAADIADAVADLFAQVTWGSAGAEAANAIEVPATVHDLQGNTLAVATTEVEVMVSDSATDAEPSATATLSAAGSPVGTILSGTGTATATWRTSSGGLFAVKVSETAAGSRFLWVKTGKNSQAWVRANASPKSVTFA